MSSPSDYASPSSDLRNNFLNAFSSSSTGRRSSAPSSLGSPTSGTSNVDEINFPGVTSFLVPTSINGDVSVDVPLFSNATVVSNTGSLSSMVPRSVDPTKALFPPPTIITTNKSSTFNVDQISRCQPFHVQRRSSLPTTLNVYSPADGGDIITNPVPEFLCHLYSMLRDPDLSEMISWCVPAEDEPDHVGGGMKGIGKIVCHQPEALQEKVLGNYYRHSKYASFQRQLNYFGFKKRLHGGKKGKLSPCSYVHEKLGTDPQSLLQLKRRPPAKKRDPNASLDSTHSVASSDDSPIRRPKKQRSETEGTNSMKPERVRSEEQKIDPGKEPSQGVKLLSSAPIQVQAEEYAAPSMKRCSSNQPTNISTVTPFAIVSASRSFRSVVLPPINTSTHYVLPALHKDTIAPANTPSAATVGPASSSMNTLATSYQQIKKRNNTNANVNENSAEFYTQHETTLQELLSTALPPSDVLFNDDDVTGSSRNGSSEGLWVTDNGKCMSHNSLVDLAMFY
mmetsp:Transcript_14976/g.30589  ORF Transcript_14976/g.30589 Transcript_14976/m.30589 type:complete len:508 (+) Transcript_14976:84-1607(+)